MGTQNRRLKPLLYFQNKLFLTTVCEHAIHLEQFRTAIEAIFSDEFRAGRWNRSRSPDRNACRSREMLFGYVRRQFTLPSVLCRYRNGARLRTLRDRYIRRIP